jgi:formylglycine-generating enzyme required for sulfatase activity
LTGKGKWIPDASLYDSGVVPFQLGPPETGRPAGPRRPTKSITAARKQFLAYLSEEHRYLQLRGFGADLRVPLELEPIYISLRAVPSHVEREIRGTEPEATGPMEEMEVGPAIEFCERNGYSGMVALGDPGSGKTTLLKFLTLCLAQGKPVKETGVKADRFPVFLPLRRVEDFTVSLDDALRAFYPMMQMDLPGDFFQRVLSDKRRPCLVMLDGLDEVATPERRREALDWIECQRKLYPHNLIVVTSRFAGYRGQTRLPENYMELHVRDFRDEDVRTFVSRWYRQVETRQRGDTKQWREHARGLSDDLVRQLTASESLLALARNPLMLQIICLVHRTHKAMPKRRTELYEECIKVLLQKWDEAKGLEVYLTAAEARQVLRPLALWLHQEEGRTHADVEEVKQVIGPHLARVKRETEKRAEEQLDRVLTSVRDRSGLFVGFDVARYGFQHLSFQEFLAAEEIVKQGLHARLVETFGRSWWREPTLLSLGMDDPRFQAELFAQLVRSPGCQQNLDLALTCVREALAPGVLPFAEALADVELPWQMRHNCALFLREIGGSEAVQALRRALGDPEPKVAAAARDALLRLGELEEAAAAPAAAAADTIVNDVDGTELVRIPAGEFLMGSDDGPKEERPQHRVHLDEYYIAKHPVTNAQYRRFIEATAHRTPQYLDEKRFNQPNQPVVTVTWYDAMAYCKWAGLRLPTEREWEKAARGTDGRKWPWGDDPPDEKRCNFGENVGATTEVGSYPDGASPYGCLDMAGNVWEWCMSKWRESYEEEPDDSGEGEELRILRGGAWWNDANAVRCSRRLGYRPGDWVDDIGFRCAQ